MCGCDSKSGRSFQRKLATDTHEKSQLALAFSIIAAAQ
jgi:hypothetical protein